jgi:hypothetical protein
MAAIVLGALAGGVSFSHIGNGLAGWHLLALQSLMYGILSVVIQPRRSEQETVSSALPLMALGGVGLVAGWSSGLLGVGGGLVMVQGLGLRVYLAIRLSTLAVCASASAASLGFLADGRSNVAMGLLLGGTAALASQWSAARLQRVSEDRLVWLLRLLTVLLALDSGRRAFALAMAAR